MVVKIHYKKCVFYNLLLIYKYLKVIGAHNNICIKSVETILKNSLSKNVTARCAIQFKYSYTLTHPQFTSDPLPLPVRKKVFTYVC